jgi:hypothetical protein
MLPQIVIWPFMARTMVEAGHVVKPLLAVPAKEPGERRALSF